MKSYYRFGQTINAIRKDNKVKITSLIDGIMSRTEYFRYSKNEVDISFDRFAALLVRLQVSYQDIAMWAKRIDNEFITPGYSSSVNITALTLQPFEQVEAKWIALKDALESEMAAGSSKNQRMLYLTVILLMRQHQQGDNQKIATETLKETMLPYVSIDEALDYIVANTAWDYVEVDLVALLIRYMKIETVTMFINKLTLNALH